jgi:hypothetical protein
MWLLWSFDIENYDNLWVLVSKDWIFHASYSSRWGMSYHWGLRPWILFCVWWHGHAMYLCIYCFVLFLTVLYCFVLYRFSQMFTPRKPEPPGQDLCDQAAYVGKYPSTAPCESQQLDKRQARLAGKSMSHRFALTELRGDWKWHREFWLMKRHYKAKDVCLCCFASIYSGPTQYLMSALIVFSLISCSPHKSIGWRVSATTHNPPQPWYIYIISSDPVQSLTSCQLRYTQFEDMPNFPRMTVPQWYLYSLKDYVNPLCVSWLWIKRCCADKWNICVIH